MARMFRLAALLLFRSWEWLKWRWRKKTRHGVHSPFVFQLIEQVLRPRGYPGSNALLAVYRLLKTSGQQVRIIDHGAGYDADGQRERFVSLGRIARSSARTPADGARLAQLIAYLKPTRILEFGSNIGVGTSWLHLGAPAADLHTVEGSPELASIARQTVQQVAAGKAASVAFHVGTFQQFLQSPAASGPWEFVLLDGHHTAAATLAYWQALKPYLSPGACVQVDDIRWSPDMLRAWNALRLDPDVTVSIDLFDAGLLFFQRPQATEHFSL